MASTGKIRAAAIGLVVALAVLWAIIAAGLRFNGTHSFPVGLYMTISKRPARGDLVTINPPPLPIFDMARERGYLSVVYNPIDHLMKRIVATAGDRVTIDSAGVEDRGAPASSRQRLGDSWQHISGDNLRDSVGIKLPKLAA